MAEDWTPIIRQFILMSVHLPESLVMVVMFSLLKSDFPEHFRRQPDGKISKAA